VCDVQPKSIKIGSAGCGGKAEDGWESGQHVKEQTLETNVRNSVCHANIEHGLRQLAADLIQMAKC
jgi:hypothetical protein